MRAIRILAVVLMLVSGIAARASQDQIMPISEVRLASPGLEKTGPVVVTGTMEGGKWKSLTIEAFAKKQVLTEKQLEALKDFPLNSLKLQYGDYSVDGRDANEKAVHVVASTFFLSTPFERVVDNAKESYTETISHLVTASVTITVTADRGVEVGEPVKDMQTISRRKG